MIKQWKEFCRYLHIDDKQNKRKALAFFIEEPYFEASWKKVALALYYSFEDDTIDALFFYVKSPAGYFIIFMTFMPDVGKPKYGLLHFLQT